MAEQPRQNLGQAINTWVQTFGIVIAAGWGFYTFVYKEIVLPQSAPVNITINLQLKKIGSGNPLGSDPKKKLVAIEMRVAATNPSAREVYLLTSAWIAYGIVDGLSTDTLSAEAANNAINSRRGAYVQKHAEAIKTPVVAVGNLFKDAVLKPSEATSRTIIIYVPAETYDRMEVYALIPTVTKEHGLALDWKLEGDSLATVMYSVDANGKRKEMEMSLDKTYSERSHEFQLARSVSEISLWQ